MPAEAAVSVPSTGVIAFDEFELDVPGFELRRLGEPVSMEPQVFEVLAFLVENAGRVLTKDEILDRVWPERYVSEASLNSRVMSARKALGDSGSEQRYIKTVHGRGYRFVAPVSPAEASHHHLPPAMPAVHLPEPGSSFVGRSEELARIVALLEQPACRLLTVAGPGGIGKTRLATEAAAALAGRTAEVVFVQLEHVDERSFLSALAAALGVQPSAGDMLDHIVGYLSTHSLVLVLDNVEHLVSAARPALEAILGGARGVKLLLTSRIALGTPQEWVLRIAGLSLEPRGGDAPSDAVQLFLDRAGPATPYTANGASAEVVAICRLVDGLPLAIELAASLLQYFPPAAILDLIERNAAAAICAPLHDLPERQRSVEALFDESLRLLSPVEQAGLCALAAFEGTFDAVAAEAVAGAGISSLGALVNASLLAPRDGRFGMHPLLRQSLLSRPGSSVEDVRRAHAEYYTGFAAGYEPALRGRGQLAAVEAIDVEATNLFAAWRWAVANNRIDLVEQARQPLFSYLVFRGRFIDADNLAEVALDVLEPEHVQTRSALLVHHGWVLMRLGQMARALNAFAESVETSRAAELPWKPGFGSDARIAAAAIRVGAGDYFSAFDAATMSLALAEAAGDEAGAAFASWLAGVALFRQSRVDMVRDAQGRIVIRALPGETRLVDSLAYIERAAAYVEPLGETWLQAFVEIERGLNAGANNQHERAVGHFRAAYRLRRQLDDPQGMGSALLYLCDTLSGMGQAESARALYPEIRQLLARSGDASGVAELLRSEGSLALTVGELELARRRLREAIVASRAIGFANNVIGALRALADVFVLEGCTELAVRMFSAVATHHATNPGTRARALLSLAELSMPEPTVETTDHQLESVVQEALRVSAPLDQWLVEDDPVVAGSAA